MESYREWKAINRREAPTFAVLAALGPREIGQEKKDDADVPAGDAARVVGSVALVPIATQPEISVAD